MSDLKAPLPLDARDIYDLANEGTNLPADRALATYAHPDNWSQIYNGEGAEGYTALACEWAFIGPMRPGYELAQHALRDMQALQAHNERLRKALGIFVTKGHCSADELKEAKAVLEETRK